MSELLDRVKRLAEESRGAAEGRYAELLEDLHAGKAERSPEEVAEILAAVGRSPGDVSADLERLLTWDRIRQRVAGLIDIERECDRASEELTRLGKKRDRVVLKIEKEYAVARQVFDGCVFRKTRAWDHLDRVIHGAREQERGAWLKADEEHKAASRAVDHMRGKLERDEAKPEELDPCLEALAKAKAARADAFKALVAAPMRVGAVL